MSLLHSITEIPRKTREFFAMVKERTVVIGFLAVIVTLAIIFILVKIAGHDDPLDWEGSGSGSGSGDDSDETTKLPKCQDSSEEASTTVSPDSD